MVKNSKMFTKNGMSILFGVIILILIVILLYVLFKRNRSYESFRSSASRSGDRGATGTKSSSTTVPHLKGNYSKTCSNVKYTDSNKSAISATCKNKKGKGINSTLSLPCNDGNGISNCNGKLKCGRC